MPHVAFALRRGSLELPAYSYKRYLETVRASLSRLCIPGPERDRTYTQVRICSFLSSIWASSDVFAYLISNPNSRSLRSLRHQLLTRLSVDVARKCTGRLMFRS